MKLTLELINILGTSDDDRANITLPLATRIMAMLEDAGGAFDVTFIGEPFVLFQTPNAPASRDRMKVSELGILVPDDCELCFAARFAFTAGQSVLWDDVILGYTESFVRTTAGPNGSVGYGLAQLIAQMTEGGGARSTPRPLPEAEAIRLWEDTFGTPYHTPAPVVVTPVPSGPLVGGKISGTSFYFPGPGDSQSVPAGTKYTDERGTFNKVVLENPFGGARYWEVV